MTAARIAVAGATGAVGRHVVDAVIAAGHEPVPLSRAQGVDVTTGAGLAAALAGVTALIDVSNTTSQRRAVARTFFETATRTLLAVEQRAGVGHHVALSIVNCDRLDIGYYAAKCAQERLVLADDRGTVLRATQFHEIVGQLLARLKGPVAPVPRARTQPVSAREVAVALVELATGQPQGMAGDIAGPEPRDAVDLVRRQLRADGSRQLVVPIRVPGGIGRQLRDGVLLPSGAGRRGRVTFEQFLASR